MNPRLKSTLKHGSKSIWRSWSGGVLVAATILFAGPGTGCSHFVDSDRAASPSRVSRAHSELNSAGSVASPGTEAQAETETGTVAARMETDPELASGVPGPPYVLNVENIVRLVYARNPGVRAAREEMKAATHGLDEFRANLNRLEPFVELRNDLSSYPNRRGAFGDSVESVVGIQKETFEGAIVSAEVGGAVSRFEFDRAMPGQETDEAGGGALVRARAEMPFFGSRRRQNRIIAQAFQESTARKAQLDYLKSYRAIVDDAIDYYSLVVYYTQLVGVYQDYVDDLERLIEDDRLQPGDRPRVQSVIGSAATQRNLYEARRQEYQTAMLALSGIGIDDEFEIAIPDFQASRYSADAEDAEALEALIQKARDNNPAFTVLRDAIHNTELQRQQAISGRYDLTTFIVGTLFPLGSETFDDRLDGWTVGTGANVRLNDKRVLRATRLKAEAQIRQFEAEIESEELLMRRRIVTETNGLRDNDLNRAQILEVIRTKTSEYQSRLKDYFDGRINIDQLIETRSNLAGSGSSLASNDFNTANRESRLLLALGTVYEIVGLEIGAESPAD